MLVGDVLVLIMLAVFAAVLVGAPIAVHIEKKRDEKLLQDTRRMVIGDGVTLGEGIEALFGGDAWWIPEDTYVFISAGTCGGPKGTLTASPGTGEITVSYFDPEGRSREEFNRPELLMETMIREAKSRS